MATMSIRLDATHTARVDEIVAAQPLPTSRNAIVQHIATLVLQGRLDEAGRLAEMGTGPAKSLLRLARDPEARARFNEGAPSAVQAVIGAGSGVRTMTREEVGLPPAEALKVVRVPVAEADGARLRRLREDAGVTQAHVAEAAEVSVDQVRRFEQGRRVSERAATKLRWWAREREGGAG